MSVRMAGTIRTAVVALALVSGLLSGAVVSFGGPPDSGPGTVAKYGFESPADSFASNAANTDYVVGETPTSAYWGRTAQDMYTGSAALWCAGTAYPAGTPSNAWPTYLPGTRGKTSVTLPELAEYYSASVSMMYKMETLGADGAEDYFAFVRKSGTRSGYTILPVTGASGWLQYTYDLSASTSYPRLSRVPASLGLEFYDYTEGSFDGLNKVGTGPLVDDFTVFGYKYGPIRSVSVSSPAEGQVALSWPTPYDAVGSSVPDTRTISYRVWRAETGTELWTELTAGGRVSANAFTDVSAVIGKRYVYVVQAWDPGTGQGRGEQSAAAALPASTYTITSSSGAGGSISPNTIQTVDAGASKAFTIIPTSGYRIADVKVDGVSIGAVPGYVFTNLTANHTIAASFDPIPANAYTVTPSAGAGGSISPATVQTVSHGSASPAFTITPASGYRVADVLVDGVSVGAVTTYTFSNVTANHAIAASFAANAPVVPTPVTLSTTTKLSGPASIKVGRTLKLTGTVSPSAAPGKVTIVKTRLVGKKWRSAGSATVSVSGGTYRYSFKPTKKGTWRLVAKYTGGRIGPDSYKASSSRTKSVKVG
jgi:hypothetical protein